MQYPLLRKKLRTNEANIISHIDDSGMIERVRPLLLNEHVICEYHLAALHIYRNH